jgi:hypothetical protein
MSVRARAAKLLRVIGALFLVLVLISGVSIVRALRAPGTDSTAARLAEWGRSHGLSSVIDRLEQATYQAPRVGGKLPLTSPLIVPASPGSAQSGEPAPIVPMASPALAGEGVWRPLKLREGRPLLQVAYLRPDALHTSYTAAAVWMDTARLRFVLHPGVEEPGHGPWPVPALISTAERPNLLAAFNGGFRIDAARGGFQIGKHSVGSLRIGAASLVVLSDGSVTVGQWGRDVGPSQAPVAVRQNLDLLVDDGRPVAGLADNRRGKWGRTLGNKLFVWRSGVGVTRTGALVYVAGNRLSSTSLAGLLSAAGCVRAMELDINPEWTSFVTYAPAAANILPDMQRSPHRYDTTSTRDFMTVSTRG